MNISRALLSLPLRRHTVVGVLLMATVLFIVYQFTFVAELSESSKPHKYSAGSQQHSQKGGRQSGQQDREHARNVENRKERMKIKKETGPINKREESDIVNGVKIDTQKEQSQKDNHALKGSEVRNNVLSVLFKCETSGKVVSVDKLNDNYCDCPEDGSDEPRTNACANGKFSCLKQIKPFPVTIPSGWVNDGVCDCCDGSDEWKMRKLDSNLSVNLQRKVGRYLSPCPDQCPDET